jgi:glycosyltransferase involved in cell wall biosynthesis
VEVYLIGFDKNKENLLKFPYKLIDWSEETEVENMCNFDIGIMPLVDSLFERGKCGFKLIQYMGCGLPVIASNVGENKYIVNDSNGFLIKEENGWLSSIEKLVEDSKLRNVLGESGRKLVENKYSTENNSKKYIEFIKRVYEKNTDY